MDADYFRTLFGQLNWARDKVLAAAEGMSEEEYARPNGFTYKSIRGILTHCLVGEANFMARARGEATVPTREEDVPTVEKLRARWAEEQAKTDAYLAELKDEDLTSSVTFTGRDGNPRTMIVWHILTLVFQHTTQHRTEAAEALTMVGRSPGDVDFMVYIGSLAAAK